MAKLAGIVAAGALLYGARRYYRNWGTTKDETKMRLPGDELIRDPIAQTTEGVWIDRPADAVWPWLVQMGLERGGLYNSERMEKLIGQQHHNDGRIHPEHQQLTAGDEVRLSPPGWLWLPDGLVLRVEQVIDGEAVVLRAAPPVLPWEGVWSFHLLPRGADKCRLLVRGRGALRRPGQVLAAEAGGPVAALMTRGMLLGVKRRAEAVNPPHPS